MLGKSTESVSNKYIEKLSEFYFKLCILLFISMHLYTHIYTYMCIHNYIAMYIISIPN